MQFVCRYLPVTWAPEIVVATFCFRPLAIRNGNGKVLKNLYLTNMVITSIQFAAVEL